MTAKHLGRIELANPGNSPGKPWSADSPPVGNPAPSRPTIAAYRKAREEIGSNSIKQSGDRVNCQEQL